MNTSTRSRGRLILVRQSRPGLRRQGSSQYPLFHPLFQSSNKNVTQSSTIMDTKPGNITKVLLVVRVRTPALACNSTACAACITGCDRVLLSFAHSLIPFGSLAKRAELEEDAGRTQDFVLLCVPAFGAKQACWSALCCRRGRAALMMLALAALACVRWPADPSSSMPEIEILDLFCFYTRFPLPLLNLMHVEQKACTNHWSFGTSSRRNPPNGAKKHRLIQGRRLAVRRIAGAEYCAEATCGTRR